MRKMTDHTNDTTRRRFLAMSAGTAVVTVLPILEAAPAHATQETLAAAIREVVGGNVVRVGKVKLDLPPLVENGNTVPITVSVASPMTDADYVRSIHIFNEKNPQPNVGN